MFAKFRIFRTTAGHEVSIYKSPTHIIARGPYPSWLSAFLAALRPDRPVHARRRTTCIIQGPTPFQRHHAYRRFPTP